MPMEGFRIPYPLLWLAAAVLVVYFPTFSFGLTELDDKIFINEFREYNEDLHNLVVSFQRGVFDAVKDPYYRPLFLNSMILNYHLSGDNVTGYHIVNVLFHLISVLLLYKLFRKLEVRELHAFLLTLVFAVHPVLSQAVAWIPGRNDTLLTIFILAFLIQSITYSQTGNRKNLLLSALFLLLSFFTKETAVFAAPTAFVLLILVLNKKWLDKNNLIQYGVWVGCFLLWFVVRMQATIQSAGVDAGQAAKDFVHRLPVIIQYTGKIFLPFNLSAFPIQEDTVYYYGIAAIILIVAIIILNKQRNLKTILAGSLIFLLFLLPVLLVPAYLNEQIFEHRLYLPMVGMLLLLSQSVLLQNKLSDKNLFIAGTVVCVLFAGINFNHQKNFEDPHTFWSHAAETSPHSAYANMMLGARSDDDFKEACNLFRKAYQLNPKEKYLNFYYGVMLQKLDSVKESEKYLLAEKANSDYYECDFYLARVAMNRRDLNGAITYLQDYLKKDSNNKIASSNLLLLYMDTQQPEKARAHASAMRAKGMEVPRDILQRLGL